MSEAYDFGLDEDSTYSEDSSLTLMTLSTIKSEYLRLSGEQSSLEEQIDQLETQYITLDSQGLIPADLKIDFNQNNTKVKKIATFKSVIEHIIELYSNNTNNIDKITSHIKELSTLQNFAYLAKGAKLLYIQKNEQELCKDRYGTFEEYLKNALGMSKSAAYDCIDLVKYFAKSTRVDSELKLIADNKSKVKLFLPIFKSNDIDDRTKSELRENIISKLNSKSYREMQVDAKEEKAKFNIGRNNKSSELDELEQKIRKVIYKIRQGMKDGKTPIITWE